MVPYLIAACNTIPDEDDAAAQTQTQQAAPLSPTRRAGHTPPTTNLPPTALPVAEEAAP